MKKLMAIVFLVLLLTFGAAGAEMVHVTDEANVLTDRERARLQQMAEELYQKTGFDVILHTTNNSQRKTPFDYSMDYYHSFRNPDKYPNGALFSILFDIRDYYEAARGSGISLLSEQGEGKLQSVVQSKLSDDDYYDALSNYVRYVRRILIPPTPMERAIELFPYLLAGGMVIGLFYAFFLRSQIKTPKYRYDAQNYVLRNSLDLTDARDIYLYQTTTRTKIESSGGGSGGSRSHSSGSRGGTSYGGRGGKF